MASPVVLLMWLIGYSAARHVLSNYEEAHMSFYSLVWGFVIAEIGWLAYHWTFAYELSGVGDIKLVQSAVIITSLSFVAERIYASYTKHGEVRSGDIILPALLSVSLIVILLVFFNRLGAGTI
jgi:amino acid permease